MINHSTTNFSSTPASSSSVSAPSSRDTVSCPDWDDLVCPAASSPLLAPGIYRFRITRVEKGFYEPDTNGKLPPCHKATLTLAIDGGSMGSVTCHDNFFLIDRFNWKATALLQALGVIGPDEPFRWRQLTEVEGLSGSCEIETQEYTGRDGQTHRKNAVLRYLKNPSPAQQEADSVPQKHISAPQKPFQKGVF